MLAAAIEAAMDEVAKELGHEPAGVVRRTALQKVLCTGTRPGPTFLISGASEVMEMENTMTADEAIRILRASGPHQTPSGRVEPCGDQGRATGIDREALIYG